MRARIFYGDNFLLERERQLFFKDHETFIKEAEEEKDLVDLMEEENGKEKMRFMSE